MSNAKQQVTKLTLFILVVVLFVFHCYLFLNIENVQRAVFTDRETLVVVQQQVGWSFAAGILVGLFYIVMILKSFLSLFKDEEKFKKIEETGFDERKNREINLLPYMSLLFVSLVVSIYFLCHCLLIKTDGMEQKGLHTVYKNFSEIENVFMSFDLTTDEPDTLNHRTSYKWTPNVTYIFKMKKHEVIFKLRDLNQADKLNHVLDAYHIETQSHVMFRASNEEQSVMHNDPSITPVTGFVKAHPQLQPLLPLEQCTSPKHKTTTDFEMVCVLK